MGYSRESRVQLQGGSSHPDQLCILVWDQYNHYQDTSGKHKVFYCFVYRSLIKYTQHKYYNYTLLEMSVALEFGTSEECLRFIDEGIVCVVWTRSTTGSDW